MTDKYLCIHGHFYQPPRENPWLEAIEYQDEARPFHNWNERITRECYGPNARARLPGQGGRILKLVNNYEYMSFNFGPTLLSWLEKAHPWVYSQILAADRASRIRYQGHGNALAQVYNHIIMPLARRRDKLTQILWGLADFKRRFGHPAEGMWLAETAVDSETLDLLAQEGVKFTILSPTQAQSVRPLASQELSGSWEDISGGRIDTTKPYRVCLDKLERRFIDVFFYNSSLSRAVAYKNMLASGKGFLGHIEEAFKGHHKGPQLVSVATDGESYGHHSKFGEMALSWLFYHLEQTGQIKLINYALFLEQFPSENEVNLFENTSWSCPHGVERWRADCGCSVNHTPGWKQAWRAPLREVLDWLDDELAAIFEQQAGQFFKDPWQARDDYITVFLHPSPSQRESFLKRHATRPLGTDEKVEALQLMESQRMSLFMFTSCGWFFDDISGLEATQVLKYAARAIDLVQLWARRDLEAGIIDFLVKAKSNEPAYGHGGRVWQALVKPSRMDSSRATAHYAITALLEELPQEVNKPFATGGLCYGRHTIPFSEIVRPVEQRHLAVQGLHAVFGEVKVTQMRTGQESGHTYVAFRRELTNLSCMVGESVPDIDLDQVVEEIRPVLTEAAWEKIGDIFCRHIPAVKNYGFKDLVPDMCKCLVQVLARNLDRRIKDFIREHDGAIQELMSLLQETGEPAPEILGDILHLLLSNDLARLMATDQEEHIVDWSDLRRLAAQSKPWAMTLNEPTLIQIAQAFLRRQMEHLALTPDQMPMTNIINFLDLAQELNLELDLWECQNMFYDLYNDPKSTRSLHPELSSTFHELGRRLGFLMGGEEGE